MAQNSTVWKKIFCICPTLLNIIYTDFWALWFQDWCLLSCALVILNINKSFNEFQKIHMAIHYISNKGICGFKTQEASVFQAVITSGGISFSGKYYLLQLLVLNVNSCCGKLVYAFWWCFIDWFAKLYCFVEETGALNE